MRFAAVVLFALALYGRTAHCSEDDYDPDGPGDEDEYGGGHDHGGEDEDTPPPGGSAPEELATLADFEYFIDNADASVVGAFQAKTVADPSAVEPEGWDADEDGQWEAPMIQNPALDNFQNVANSATSYRFAYTSAPEILEKLKQKSKVGVYLYKAPKFVSKEHGDRLRERYPSDNLVVDGMTNWLDAKAQPLVGQYTSTTSARYKKAVLVIFLNLDFETNAKGVAYALKRARKVAATLKGKMQVAVASVEDMSYELADYGLESNKPKIDILMGIRDGSDFYAPTSDAAFSAPAITAFANEFLAGSLKPHVKPDPPPPPPYEDDEEGGDDIPGGDEEDYEKDMELEDPDKDEP